LIYFVRFDYINCDNHSIRSYTFLEHFSRRTWWCRMQEMFWTNLLSNIRKHEIRFLAKMSRFCFSRSLKSIFRRCFGSRETFWIGICQSESLHFYGKKRDCLIFDKNHKVPLMVWRWFLAVFFFGRGPKSVRKQVLDESNCLELFWQSKTASNTSNYCTNPPRICCGFVYVLLKKTCCSYVACPYKDCCYCCKCEASWKSQIYNNTLPR